MPRTGAEPERTHGRKWDREHRRPVHDRLAPNWWEIKTPSQDASLRTCALIRPHASCGCHPVLAAVRHAPVHSPSRTLVLYAHPPAATRAPVLSTQASKPTQAGHPSARGPHSPPLPPTNWYPLAKWPRGSRRTYGLSTDGGNQNHVWNLTEVWRILLHIYRYTTCSGRPPCTMDWSRNMDEPRHYVTFFPPLPFSSPVPGSRSWRWQSRCRSAL